MQPLSTMPSETARNVHAVLCDIDDTLTTDGQLPGAAYQAIEDLDRAGIVVAPITGRPAGWCDMIARFWPVRGVVGENGAFYYAYDRGERRMQRQYHPELERHIGEVTRFDRIRSRVAREVPRAAISADQPFRIADLAVDFCEDVNPLTLDEIERIRKIFVEEGAAAKISSIHVNGWFGDYDKLTMTRIFVSDILGIDIDHCNRDFVFVGDSPNDAPMFSFFENACGVANIREFSDQLDAMPRWVAPSDGGSGFREIADHLLSARGKD